MPPLDTPPAAAPRTAAGDERSGRSTDLAAVARQTSRSAAADAGMLNDARRDSSWSSFATTATCRRTRCARTTRTSRSSSSAVAPATKTTPAQVPVDAFDHRGGARLSWQRCTTAASAAPRRARRLAALRTFARYLVREEVLAEDPTALVGAPRKEQTLPAHLPVDDMNGCSARPIASTVAGRRDRAILELFYASGLRLSELVGLDLEDVNLSSRIARVRGQGRQGAARAVQSRRGRSDSRDVAGRRSSPGRCDASADAGDSARRPHTRRGRAVSRCSSISAAAGSPRAASIGSSDATCARPRSRRASARTRCGTRSRRTCCRPARICAPFRNCWATRGSSTTQRYTHLDVGRLMDVSTRPRASAGAKE